MNTKTTKSIFRPRKEIRGYVLINGKFFAPNGALNKKES